MKVVAVVVAHNSARDLPDSLGALAGLGLHRIVVVDNRSTDDGRAVARRFTDLVLERPNDGFGAAINDAAAAVPDADAYLLFNPDCRIAAADYATLVAALAADPGLGAVAPLMRYPDGRPGISSGPEPRMVKEWLAALKVDHLIPNRLRARLLGRLGYLDPRPGTRTVAWVCGFCMLIRARALRTVGGFDPGYFLYFDDVDLCRRLRAAGWAIASVGAAVAEHKESASTAVVGKRRLYRAGMCVYFNRYGTAGQRLAAWALRRLPV